MFVMFAMNDSVYCTLSCSVFDSYDLIFNILTFLAETQDPFIAAQGPAGCKCLFSFTQIRSRPGFIVELSVRSISSKIFSLTAVLL